jgi:hypothetical protein
LSPIKVRLANKDNISADARELDDRREEKARSVNAKARLLETFQGEGKTLDILERL